MLSAAYGVRETPAPQPFHIPLSNLSAKVMYLPKQMAVAYGSDPPTAVRSPGPVLHHQQPVESLKRVDKFAHSDACPAESDTNLSNGEERGVTNHIAAVLHENCLATESRRYDIMYASARTKRLRLR